MYPDRKGAETGKESYDTIPKGEAVDPDDIDFYWDQSSDER